MKIDYINSESKLQTTSGTVSRQLEIHAVLPKVIITTITLPLTFNNLSQIKKVLCGGAVGRG